MSASVPQRPLGSQGLVCSAQGFGAMGITAFYPPTVSEQAAGITPESAALEAEGLATLQKTVELGINLWDS